MIWQLQHALTIIAPKLKESRSSETADETEHDYHLSINIMIFTQFVLVQIGTNKKKLLRS